MTCTHLIHGTIVSALQLMKIGLGYALNKAGVFSFGRFDKQFYASKFDPKKVDYENILHQACKIMCHEIGHMFGMAHCTFYKCLMNGCNSVEEFSEENHCGK
jgi:archaemetzincin